MACELLTGKRGKQINVEGLKRKKYRTINVKQDGGLMRETKALNP